MINEHDEKRILAAEDWVRQVRKKSFTLAEWKAMFDLATVHIEALAEVARRNAVANGDTEDLPKRPGWTDETTG